MQGLVTYVSKVEMEVASIRVKAATIFVYVFAGVMRYSA